MTDTLETPSTTTPQPEAPVMPTVNTNEVSLTPEPPTASESDIDQAAIASIRKNLAAMPSTTPVEGANPNPNIRHQISPTLPSQETETVNTQEAKPKTGLKALILGLFSKKQTPSPSPTPENISSFEAKKDQIQNPNLPTATPTDISTDKAA